MPEERVIIDPETEEIRKLFGTTEQLMLPLQSIALIQVLPQHHDTAAGEKVRSFPVIHPGEDSSK